MQQLAVDLGERTYPIYIGPGLLAQPELYERHCGSGQLLVVTNDRVAPLYLDQVVAALGDPETLVLPDGEAEKTLTRTEQVLDRLLRAGFGRDGTLVALGGGVIGDLAGFAAAIYQRGIDFIQVPTTLLAQVDSSVGGKTGVNHPLGKNMIGAFHQPRAVIADTDVLATLPDRELSAGLAEVIKYGLIRDLPFLEWLEANVDGLRAREPALLTEAIARSCRNKAEVVAADEREGGVRALPASMAIPSATPSRPAWVTANGCMAKPWAPACAWPPTCRCGWGGWARRIVPARYASSNGRGSRPGCRTA